jgi:hypothetical protein
MGRIGHTIRVTEGGDTFTVILNLCARWGVDEQQHAPAVLPCERDPEFVLQEADWARRLV